MHRGIALVLQVHETRSAAEQLCGDRLLCVITCQSAVGNSSCILEQSGRSNQLDVILHLSHRLSAFPGTLATSLNGRR